MGRPPSVSAGLRERRCLPLALAALRRAGSLGRVPGSRLGLIQRIGKVLHLVSCVTSGEIGEHECACPCAVGGGEIVQPAGLDPSLAQRGPSRFAAAGAGGRVEGQDGPGSCPVQVRVTGCGVGPVEHTGHVAARVSQDAERMQVQVQYPWAPGGCPAVWAGHCPQPGGGRNSRQQGMHGAAGLARGPRQLGLCRAKWAMGCPGSISSSTALASPASTRSKTAGIGTTAATADDAASSASITAGRPTRSTRFPAPQAEPELPPSARSDPASSPNAAAARDGQRHLNHPGIVAQPARRTATRSSPGSDSRPGSALSPGMRTGGSDGEQASPSQSPARFPWEPRDNPIHQIACPGAGLLKRPRSELPRRTIRRISFLWADCSVLSGAD